MNPASELLCLLNIAAPTPAESARIANLAQGQPDWSELVRLAELNAVQPLVFHRLRQTGLLGLLPKEPGEALEAAYEKVRERNLRRVAWTSKFLEAASQRNLEVIVLKGSLFADTIYRNRAYKKMNDLDVLVRRKDAPTTVELLQEIGFAGVGRLFGKSEIDEDSHHTPPFVSDDLACVVGLHWGLTSPLAPWKADIEEIWRERVPVQVAGAQAFQMAWEHALLHLCIHLPFFKTGLRELADVINVARLEISWEEFDSLVSAWRAGDAAYRVIALADALVPTGAPPEMIERWKGLSGSLCRTDTEERLRDPERILESRCTQVAKIEKAYAIFRLTENYTERAMAYAGMWKFLLWPKAGDLRKMLPGAVTHGFAGTAFARASAPVRIWRAMAREHGHAALVAMTVLNAWAMAKSTLLLPLRLATKGSGKSLREHPAAKLLEVLE